MKVSYETIVARSSLLFFKYTIENFGIKKFLMQAVEHGLQTSP